MTGSDPLAPGWSQRMRLAIRNRWTCGDPQSLDLWLDLNGARVQTGNSDKMIFTVAKIVSHVSQFMSLQSGDIITTGTPPGVGMGMDPPLYLKGGDRMRLGISGLGEQRQDVLGADV